MNAETIRVDGGIRMPPEVSPSRPIESGWPAAAGLALDPAG